MQQHLTDYILKRHHVAVVFGNSFFVQRKHCCDFFVRSWSVLTTWMNDRDLEIGIESETHARDFLIEAMVLVELLRCVEEKSCERIVDFQNVKDRIQV